MAAPTKSNDFVFVVNRHPLTNPCLVHLSRVSKTGKENLDCFESNVIWIISSQMPFTQRHSDALGALTDRVTGTTLVQEASLPLVLAHGYLSIFVLKSSRISR